MESKLSYQSLEPHLKNLQYVGYFQLNRKTSPIKRWLYSIYMWVALFVAFIFIVQQCIQVYKVCDDFIKVNNVLYLCLTCTAAIYKQSTFFFKSDEINEILDIMKGPLFNQSEPEHKSLLSLTARQSKQFLRLFNVGALLTNHLWVLFPFIQHLRGDVVEFTFWTPFNAYQDPQFFIAVAYLWLQTSMLSFTNSTMDIFTSFLYVQIRTQLSIIRMNLEQLVEKSRRDAQITKKSLNIQMEARLDFILKHYDEIVRFAEKVQSIFGGVIFYLFLVIGWVLCTTAFILVIINPTSVEFVSLILYLICILTELFLHCYYGNEVYHESEKVLDSAYAMDWLQCPVRLRKKLIILMIRLKRPIQPTAGIIIPLSNATFISILRSSYSFFVFLKNSENN